MKIPTKCLCCNKEYTMDTINDPVWKYEYCTKICNKIYYNIYLTGFVPQGVQMKIPTDLAKFEKLCVEYEKRKKEVLLKC